MRGQLLLGQAVRFRRALMRPPMVWFIDILFSTCGFHRVYYRVFPQKREGNAGWNLQLAVESRDNGQLNQGVCSHRQPRACPVMAPRQSR